MTLRNRRRKLPGGICPKCGEVARAVHVRYVNRFNVDMTIPVRTFVCNCGERYTYPAEDLQTALVPPNPPTP